MLQPIIGGHSWRQLIYMWKQYLHYGGPKILGRRARTRHEKMKFFRGHPYKGPVFTKTVITWSFGVRFIPTSTQNAHDKRGNLENTSGLCRRPGGPFNSAPKLDFLPLKVKEHNLPLLFRKVSEPIGTPLKGNPRDCGEYKH